MFFGVCAHVGETHAASSILLSSSASKHGACFEGLGEADVRSQGGIVAKNSTKSSQLGSDMKLRAGALPTLSTKIGCQMLGCNNTAILSQSSYAIIN